MVTAVRLPAAELTPPKSLAGAYLDALLVGDRETAEVGVRQALLDGSSLNDIYVNVFQEALYEVGRRWERAELSVAQEHFCTAATQQLMASLYEQTLQTPKVGHRLLATSIGGNFHSVGIRMLADVFELHGWETTYLGADTPSAAVIESLTSGSYDVLAISAGLEEHVPAVGELIGALRSGIPSQRLRILVGGRPFNANPSLWRKVGADGHAATPQEAVKLASRLLNPSLVVDETPTNAAPVRSPALATSEPRSPDRENDRALLEGMSRMNSQLHDLTRALAEKNAELARLNAQVNRMMGIAAHDLRNPLTIIGCNTQFLREELGPTLADDQSQLLDMIESSGAFMKRLLDDLLDVSQVRACKLNLDLETVDVVALVRKAVKLNEPLGQRKQIALEVSAHATGIELSVDAAKLQQLVNNLVGNAIQYSMPGTAVNVIIDAAPEHVQITVRDRGKGIPEAELGKVFRPFETTSTRGTAGEKSTGLGLAIVQAIVDAHRGRVWVESKAGEGTCFFVTLPRSA
jgi:signal transduction histidine kinase